MQLSKHFDSSEFECHCGCGDRTVDGQLLRILERVRRHFGVIVDVTSGKRCIKWNRLQGSKDTSQHPKGTAADIKVRGIAPSVVADYIEGLAEHVGGLGRYKTFTHVDVRGFRSRWGNN
jgi:uncharacterized protein YcbK (DUF882 family)